MKTITTILSIIIVLSLVACATAGEPVQTKAPAAQPKVDATKVLANIQKQIDSLQVPIDKATKALEAKPEWQEFQKLKAEYQQKAKQVSKLPEFIKLNRLENSKQYLLRLTEGGK